MGRPLVDIPAPGVERREGANVCAFTHAFACLIIDHVITGRQFPNWCVPAVTEPTKLAGPGCLDMIAARDTDPEARCHAV